MRGVKILVSIILICFLIKTESYALHLVGGDATYTFISYNADSTRITYDITFNLYKDRNAGANLATSETFGIYRGDGQGGWVFVTDYRARRGSLVTVERNDEPCREEPPPSQVDMEAGTYTEEITLDVIDEDYMIVYLRCCRNDGINNMNGDEAGAVIDLIITSEAQHNWNSSPLFNELPPIFICAGFPLEVDQGCTDAEGDIIRYSFCTPIAIGGPDSQATNTCDTPRPDAEFCPPPYDELTYRAGYSELAPMRGTPLIQINSSTGLITGTPEVSGLYVVGICVEEYRDGQLLSVLRRDFQFNALTCVKELSANLIADEQVIDNSTSTLPINIIRACGDSIVNFVAIDNNQGISRYQWQLFDPEGEMVLDSAGADITTIDLTLEELGEYEGNLIIRDFGDCVDTAKLRVLRLPGMQAGFQFEVTDSCYLADIDFKDKSSAEVSQIVEWEWIIENEATYTEKDVSHKFTTRGDKEIKLVARDANRCVDTTSIIIEYYPPHDSVLLDAPKIDLCYGDTLRFYNKVATSPGTYLDTIRYIETGCDSVYGELELAYYTQPSTTDIDTILCPNAAIDYYGVNYNQAGEYFHTTPSSNRSTAGSVCDSVLHYLDLEYEDQTEIVFTDNYVDVISGKDYSFPLSINGRYSQLKWSPSEGLSCLDCADPIVNFNTDTTYVLELLTEVNCRSIDSIQVNFVVVPDQYYLPTIIERRATNKDNRTLYLQTIEEALDEVTYSMKVMDRWGGLLFDGKDLQINDSSVGWTPWETNNGPFIYTIEVEEFFETRILFGTVTLVD